MKTRIANIVHSSVQLEGISSTFAQTCEIIENGTSAGVSSEDINKIIGMKRGLQYLFEHYDEDLSWELYAEYNKIAGISSSNIPGYMRADGEVFVNIGNGSSYYPEPVSEKRFYEIVHTAIDTAYDMGEAAVTMFLNLSKAQFFRDGNKRSATLLANHLLAHEDSGLTFEISEEDREKVLVTLVNYYVGDLSLNDAEIDIEDRCIYNASDDLSLKHENEPAKDSINLLSDEANSVAVALNSLRRDKSLEKKHER